MTVFNRYYFEHPHSLRHVYSDVSDDETSGAILNDEQVAFLDGIVELSCDESKEQTTVSLECKKEICLPESKSPIIESFVYCALKNIGLTLSWEKQDCITIKVDDFTRYHETAIRLISRKKVSQEFYSRVQTLRAWFDGFPRVDKHVYLTETHFTLTARPDHTSKVHAALSRMRKFIEES